ADTGQTFEPAGYAGHSLGEFTALIAAGALDFAAALPVVRERGRLMREARTGGMAAVIGMADEDLAAVCAEAAQGDVLVIANANCPGQTVISGEIAPLGPAMARAHERSARRGARLHITLA